MTRGLTARIVLFFMLSVSALLATVGYLTYRSGSGGLQDAAVSELLGKAIEKETALNASIEERRSDLERLSGYADVADKAAALISADSASEHSRAHALVINEIQPYVGGGPNSFKELFVMTPDTGEVVASTDPAQEGKNKKNHPYFERGRSALYVQPPYLSEDTHSPCMTAAAPLRTSDGRVVAVLAVRWNLATVSGIAQLRTGLRRTEDAYLVNSDGYPVTQPRFLSESAVLRHRLTTDAVRRLIARHSGVVSAPDYRGARCIAVYRWNAKQQLGLIVEIDESEALGPAVEFLRSLLLICRPRDPRRFGAGVPAGENDHAPLTRIAHRGSAAGGWTPSGAAAEHVR
jgi:hypothetical protein